jgi:seryl-tRNA synthetase
MAIPPARPRVGSALADDVRQSSEDAGLSALANWFDSRLRALAKAAGAQEITVPALIARSTLESAGYFESFPGPLVGETADGHCLSPATCYHWYAQQKDAVIEEGASWTCCALCGRKEADSGPGRLETFRMREVILAGTENWVREQRQEWMDRTVAFAESLLLLPTLAPASDPFFRRGEARGRKLLQQLKQLKYELRVPLYTPETTLAISSFNLHENFFSRRFNLHQLDGTWASTGCVAFGLERWALALSAKLGIDQARKLAGLECT